MENFFKQNFQKRQPFRGMKILKHKKFQVNSSEIMLVGPKNIRTWGVNTGIMKFKDFLRFFVPSFKDLLTQEIRLICL